MAGSVTFAWRTKSGGGGKTRVSLPSVSSAELCVVSVDMAPSLLVAEEDSGSGRHRLRRTGRRDLKGRGAAATVGGEVRGVVIGDRQEPAEAVQRAVERVGGGPGGIGFGGEVGPESLGGRGRLPGQRPDALTADAGDRGPRLAGVPGILAPGEPQGDQRDPSVDDQEVGRDLTQAPVVR